jgi:hypothetical protein
LAIAIVLASHAQSQKLPFRFPQKLAFPACNSRIVSGANPMSSDPEIGGHTRDARRKTDTACPIVKKTRGWASAVAVPMGRSCRQPSAPRRLRRGRPFRPSQP